MKIVHMKKGTAIVDDSDFERVSQHSWYLERNGYARSCIKGKKLSMHRFIMNLKTGVKIDVDHINGIRHDNRKENLRICTRSQNLSNAGLTKKNTSGFKGVSWDKNKNKWQAKITVNKKQLHLGRFDDIKSAHNAYCQAAYKINKEFANYGYKPAFGAALGVEFSASPNERKS